MYFTLSKIFWLIFVPSNLIILLLTLGGWLMLMRRRISGAILFLAGFFGIVIGTVSSLPDRALEILETRFPLCADTQDRIDGVIVLGGATSVVASAVWDRLIVNEAGSRLLVMADLARRYPDAKIVFSGGYGFMFGEPISEAELIAKHLRVFGLEPGRVIFETKSRNTIENALFSRDLVEPKPEQKWLLVTSASHMPRAYGMFHKVGFPVEACSSDYTSTLQADDTDIRFNVAERLKILNRVAREWIGLVAARIYDYTDEVLPGPPTTSN